MYAQDTKERRQRSVRPIEGVFSPPWSNSFEICIRFRFSVDLIIMVRVQTPI